MSNWPDEWAKMKQERDEWRYLARRLARVIETQRRYSMCGTRYHLYKQYKADYLAAEADVSDDDLARATAEQDGEVTCT